jgi:hypothetical protein
MPISLRKHNLGVKVFILAATAVCNKLTQNRDNATDLTYCSIKSRLHCLWPPVEGTTKRLCSFVRMKRGHSIMTVVDRQNVKTGLRVKRLSPWVETSGKHLQSEWARVCFTLIVCFTEASYVFRK